MGMAKEVTQAVAAQLTFAFTASVAATIWHIPHNLGRQPSVTVVDSGGNELIPDGVLYVDNNNITVTFTNAQAGVAYLN